MHRHRIAPLSAGGRSDLGDARSRWAAPQLSLVWHLRARLSTIACTLHVSPHLTPFSAHQSAHLTVTAGTLG